MKGLKLNQKGQRSAKYPNRWTLLLLPTSIGIITPSFPAINFYFDYHILIQILSIIQCKGPDLENKNLLSY